MRDSSADLQQEERAEESGYQAAWERSFSWIDAATPDAADRSEASPPLEVAPQNAAPLEPVALEPVAPQHEEAFLHARQPVYEANPDAVLGSQLVMTPWMLLDRLRDCQETVAALREEACAKNWGAQRRWGRKSNPLIDRLDQLSYDVAHTLFVLQRGGLWLDARDGTVETRPDAVGAPHQVARAPFTDGKPHGRPLPADAPAWVCDLLGADLPAPAAQQRKDLR